MRRIFFCLLGMSACAAFTLIAGTERPVRLYEGLGVWRHPIRTTNPTAQKFFDQGMSLAYGFNRYEALRSFRKASELDPSAAMAYWGIALAQGPYINMDAAPTFNPKASCDAWQTASRLPD